MRALFRKLRDVRFRHESLIAVLIHHERLLHNLREFQKVSPNVAVAPVLKANAYGHGLVQVARILDNEHCPFFCLDSYVEAMILRNEGIKTPLLIIGYTPLENIDRSKLKNISYGIMSLEELRRLDTKYNNPVSVHLKIDTGMHRQGILLGELGEVLKLIGKNKKITLDGAYSHLADADNPKSNLTEKQIERWNAATREVRDKFPNAHWFHLANTAGSKYADKIDANVMRLGLGLYGIGGQKPHATTAGEKSHTNSPFGVGVNLLPALEMKTRITSVRKIAAGESVGYGAAFSAKREMTVATIPVGYAEGLDRRLSSDRQHSNILKNVGMLRWTVSMSGVPCPIVGRVNMNITSIDVSAVPNPKLDDEVLVISAEPGVPNSTENMARICETIPYELLIHIPAQIRRVVVQ